MKIYETWPKDCDNKLELYNWCQSQFGDGNVDNGWSVTSHYEDRPMYEDENGELINPSPFKFSTPDEKKYSWFLMRWVV
jgi:hypothetical protein